MHVLGLPPAFVLSQDQTLRFRIRFLTCPWMESSRGSLRFDEFPTSMKRRKSRRICVQHAYWHFRKHRYRQSLDADPPKRGRHARTPPPAFPFLQITMSKSRGSAAKATLPNPRWKQIPHGESNDSRDDFPSRTRSSPASVRWIARSCLVPQENGIDPRELVI